MLARHFLGIYTVTNLHTCRQAVYFHEFPCGNNFVCIKPITRYADCVHVSAFKLLCACGRDAFIFIFDDRFEILDDVEVLKRCGMTVDLESGKCHGLDLERALRLVAVDLRPYLLGLFACFEYLSAVRFSPTVIHVCNLNMLSFTLTRAVLPLPQNLTRY
jgi:Transcription factor DP